MFKVKMAVILTAVLLISLPISGRAGLVAKGDLGSQNSNPTDTAGLTPGQLDESGKPHPAGWVPLKDNNPGKPGPSGPPGPRGLRGYRGFRGKTVVDHQGHKRVYQYIIKYWHLATTTYVDNAIRTAIGELEKQQNTPANPPPPSSTKPSACFAGFTETGTTAGATDASPDWQGIVAVILLLVMLWKWRYILDCLNTAINLIFRRKPAPEPEPGPDMTNADVGNYYGYDNEPARIELRCDGQTRSRKFKGVRNDSEYNRESGSEDSGFQWVRADKTIEVPFKIGDTLTFALCRDNTGHVPIATEGMIVKDDFKAEEIGRLVPNSGRLVVRKKVVASLNDDFIKRVMRGEEIDIYTEVIDAIPARSSINILYQVFCVPKDGHVTDDRPVDASEEPDEKSGSPIVRLSDLEAKWAEEAAAEAKAKAKAEKKAQAEEQPAAPEERPAVQLGVEAEVAEVEEPEDDDDLGTGPERRVEEEVEKPKTGPKTGKAKDVAEPAPKKKAGGKGFKLPDIFG